MAAADAFINSDISAGVRQIYVHFAVYTLCCMQTLEKRRESDGVVFLMWCTGVGLSVAHIHSLMMVCCVLRLSIVWCCRGNQYHANSCI